MHHGMTNTYRESPRRVGIKNLSYTHLPPMPHSLEGHQAVVEHSPSRMKVIEHRRSPLREVFVQEKHITPPMGMVGVHAPPPPHPMGSQMHVIVRKPEHH
jgi:hypothetical protein